MEARGISPGAVLLVQTGGRLFALTFGVGFHAIDDALKERDFGLLVTANSIEIGCGSPTHVA